MIEIYGIKEVIGSLTDGVRERNFTYNYKAIAFPPINIVTK